MAPSTDRKPAAELREFGRFAGLGLQFALTMAVLGALGWWLDSLLGTRPWLLVLGVLLGAVGGFVKIVKSVPPARAVHPTRPALSERDPADDEREGAE